MKYKPEAIKRFMNLPDKHCILGPYLYFPTRSSSMFVINLIWFHGVNRLPVIQYQVLETRANLRVFFSTCPEENFYPSRTKNQSSWHGQPFFAP